MLSITRYKIKNYELKFGILTKTYLIKGQFDKYIKKYIKYKIKISKLNKERSIEIRLKTFVDDYDYRKTLLNSIKKNIDGDFDLHNLISVNYCNNTCCKTDNS